MAHVTKGEQIVPKPVLDANPVIAHLIAQAIRNAGADPDQYKVGSGMSHNPDTNHPEFGFFSSIFRSIKKAAPFIAPIAASLIPGVGPLAGAAIGAAGGAIGGGGIKGTLIGAATGGVGGYVNAAGGVGNAVGGALNKAGFGNAAYDLLDGASGAGEGILGGASKLVQAASLGSSLFGSPSQASGSSSQASAPAAATQAFKPKRPDALSAPLSLGDLSGYDQTQQRSALATKGVNGGLGQDENAYYRNLLQRSLIGDNNKVDTSNPNFLLPVESNYFSRQGTNTSDVMKFLQGIQS